MEEVERVLFGEGTVYLIMVPYAFAALAALACAHVAASADVNVPSSCAQTSTCAAALDAAFVSCQRDCQVRDFCFVFGSLHVHTLFLMHGDQRKPLKVFYIFQPSSHRSSLIPTRSIH